MYVYQRSEQYIWTTGFFDPSGKWHPEQDCNSPQEAAERVHWLNGGKSEPEPEPYPVEAYQNYATEEDED